MDNLVADVRKAKNNPTLHAQKIQNDIAWNRGHLSWQKDRAQGKKQHVGESILLQ
jgi:hypothetical protein